jgi:hypothetical protein
MFYAVTSFLYNHLNIEYYNVIFINVAFKALQIYSEIQIILKKVTQSYPINCSFNFFKDDKNKKLNLIDSVKGYEIMYRDSKDVFLNTKTLDAIMDLNFRNKSDFFVYKDMDSTPINIKIIKDFKRLFIEETYNYKLSDIKFILVELIVKEKKYKIDLLTKTQNFYIIDNILDKNFFLYYLKNIHKDKIDLIENEFKVKIIDHNVNVVEINFQDKNSIILGEKDYKII